MQLLCWRFRASRSFVVTCVFVIVVTLKLLENRTAVQNTHYHRPSPPSDGGPIITHITSPEDIKLDLRINPIQFPDDTNNIDFGNQKRNSSRVVLQEISYPGHPGDSGDVLQKSGYTISPANPGDKLITILLWNPFFKSEDYYFGIGHQPFIDNQCKVQACQTTRDHAYLDTAEAVVFHGPRVDEPMPSYRPPGQLYGYVQAEPHYNGSMTYLPTMGDMFNITLTNRRDSDIYIAYGMVMPSSTAGRSRADAFVSPFSKTKAVVWPVSHCNTPGRRERYVVELANHIQVDIYGACGTLVCPKSDECMEQFTREYRFYLALENHYCKDYVSEKLYRTLEFDIVPIVFGGADYSKDAPPHSVINIVDYPNPKDLAIYLEYLSNNATAYNEYFEWKKHYVIEHFRHVIYGGVFCRLCEILHDPDYQYRDYTNLYSWWVDGMCDANVVGRMARKYHWFVDNFRF